MKVGIVCPYDLSRRGGVQDQCFKLADWLRGCGDEAVVIGPGNAVEGAMSVGRVRVISANGAKTPIALEPGLGRHIANAAEGCDVLHIHEPLMPSVSVAATSLDRFPKVGTFHADPPRWVRGGYRLGSLALRRLMARLDVVTAVSPVAATAVRPMAAARVIPNGIDTGLFNSRKKHPYTVGFLGRNDPRKGLDVLLEAWPGVLEAVPGATLRVVTPDRSEEVADVEFLGELDEEAKHAFLGETLILCAPNLAGESFGLVVAEGMAASCAVVASALPAFVHVLGGTGVLVKPGDAAGLAQSLVALLSDPGRAAALGEAARARVARFDRDQVVAAYRHAYQDAVKDHG